MYPIIILSLTGILTLFLGFSLEKKWLFYLTQGFILLALLSLGIDWNEPGLYFYEMVKVNQPNIIFGGIVLVSAFLLVGLSQGFFEGNFNQPAEYYALLQFSLVGALMMVFYQHFIMFFVGVEILSIALYVLTGSDKQNLRSNEAALKYFLMGAFATSVLLFGVAMYYGAVGSFKLSEIATLYQNDQTLLPFLMIGTILITIGFLFKISAAPFHFWTADVYEGAPTFFTAYMSVIVKISGFYALYKLLSSVFSTNESIWLPLIIGSVILSLLLGNLMAIGQNNFKRIMAFSGVSHAGFMLLALLGINGLTTETLGFYSIAYSLASILAFGVLLVLSKNSILNGRPNVTLQVFNGLFKKEPMLAIMLSVSMLSLAGIPLTVGFWAKFFVLKDAVNNGQLLLVIFALIMSVLSLVYYFKPIAAAFKADSSGSTENIYVPSFVKLVLSIAFIGVLALGIFPDLFKTLF